MRKRDISVRSGSFGRAPFTLGILLALGGCADGGAAPSPKDAASEAGMEVGPDGKGGDTFVPVDEESCRNATLVSSCMPSPALATIRSAPGGASLAKLEVTSGPCTVGACVGGCANLQVTSVSPSSASCEIRAVAVDGSAQSVRLDIIDNPVPIHACCSSMSVPGPGMWVVLNPKALSPSEVTVGFGVDGGQPDLPLAPVDAPPPGVDAPAGSDDGGSQADAQWITIVDGRRLQLVDYCPPIKPLPADLKNNAYRCVESFAEAAAIAAQSPDAFSAPAVERCLEGALIYYPQRWSGIVCFYGADTGRIIGIRYSIDTPAVCGVGDLAAYTVSVYGELVECSRTLPIAVDGGAVDSGASAAVVDAAGAG